MWLAAHCMRKHCAWPRAEAGCHAGSVATLHLWRILPPAHTCQRSYTGHRFSGRRPTARLHRCAL
eukprot:7517351-Alexandrium_andersonii.AAC.1